MRGQAARAAALPKELSVDSMKAQMSEPGKLMQTMRDTLRREDLTDEQRRQAMQNSREVMRATMAQRVDEYFDAPEEDKTTVLDRHIDEFLARMAEWEKARSERPELSEEERERMQNTFPPPTQEQRKARSESIDPDRMARAMAYFSAVRSRMGERGIKMPSRPGGRGGPRGPFGP
jgi:hypothetical protein